MLTFPLINPQQGASIHLMAFVPFLFILLLSLPPTLPFLSFFSHPPRSPSSSIPHHLTSPLRAMWDRVMLSDSEDEALPTTQSLQVQPVEGGGDQENKDMADGEDKGMKW